MVARDSIPLGVGFYPTGGTSSTGFLLTGNTASTRDRIKPGGNGQGFRTFGDVGWDKRPKPNINADDPCRRFWMRNRLPNDAIRGLCPQPPEDEVEAEVPDLLSSWPRRNGSRIEYSKKVWKSRRGYQHRESEPGLVRGESSISTISKSQSYVIIFSGSAQNASSSSSHSTTRRRAPALWT
jgi:hypothetical protein